MTKTYPFCHPTQPPTPTPTPYTFRPWAFLLLPSVAATFTLLASPLLQHDAPEQPVLALAYHEIPQPLHSRSRLWSHLLLWTGIALFEALALVALAVLEDVKRGRTRLRFFVVVGTLVGLCFAAECFAGVHVGVEWDATYRLAMAGTRFCWTLVVGVALGVLSEGGLWALREEGVEMLVFLSGICRPEEWRYVEIGRGGRISMV